MKFSVVNSVLHIMFTNKHYFKATISNSIFAYATFPKMYHVLLYMKLLGQE